MAEPLADDLRMDTLLQQLRRMAVSKVMEPDMWHVRPSDESCERRGKGVWWPRRAVLAGKNQVLVLIDGTKFQFSLSLLPLDSEREAPQHANKVPVVKYTGSTPARIGKGNTSVPNLEIVDWVDRPAGLQGSNGSSEKPADPNEKTSYNL